MVVGRHRRFALFALTDPSRISWRTAVRASARVHTLRLRAPEESGVYDLSVTASEHTASATLIVRQLDLDRRSASGFRRHARIHDETRRLGEPEPEWLAVVISADSPELGVD